MNLGDQKELGFSYALCMEKKESIGLLLGANGVRITWDEAVLLNPNLFLLIKKK